MLRVPFFLTRGNLSSYLLKQSYNVILILEYSHLSGNFVRDNRTLFSLLSGSISVFFYMVRSLRTHGVYHQHHMC